MLSWLTDRWGRVEWDAAEMSLLSPRRNHDVTEAIYRSAVSGVMSIFGTNWDHPLLNGDRVLGTWDTSDGRGAGDIKHRYNSAE